MQCSLRLSRAKHDFDQLLQEFWIATVDSIRQQFFRGRRYTFSKGPQQTFITCYSAMDDPPCGEQVLSRRIDRDQIGAIFVEDVQVQINRGCRSILSFELGGFDEPLSRSTTLADDAGAIGASANAGEQSHRNRQES